MRRGIWIMQTCTARQLPTSRLRIEKSQTCLNPYYRNIIFNVQNVLCLPQTDVVLHRKLDPVHYLRKLWYHCQQCDANKVLHNAHNHCHIETTFLQILYPTLGHCRYLGDGGVGQQGLDVLREEISTAGHQDCGNYQHHQSPPAGPVDYVMTCGDSQLLTLIYLFLPTFAFLKPIYFLCSLI